MTESPVLFAMQYVSTVEPESVAASLVSGTDKHRWINVGSELTLAVFLC